MEKVNKIIKKLGYKPNVFARNLALNKTHTFAVLLPKKEDLDYWKTTLEGIKKAEKELSVFGLKIKYYFHNYSVKSFNLQAAKIIKDKPLAVLFAPLDTESTLEFIAKCKKAPISYALIDSNISNQTPVTYVGQDAFRSGHLAGKLCGYSKSKKILVVKIAPELENNAVLKQRTEGFYSYYKENKLSMDIEELNFNTPESVRLNKYLSNEKNNSIHAVFVPNSRAHIVAQHLKKNNLKIRLIGYDLISKNIEFLKADFIDFLINQKPEQQGYIGINALYRKLILKDNVNEINYMPIEIIVKENVEYSLG